MSNTYKTHNAELNEDKVITVATLITTSGIIAILIYSFQYLFSVWVTAIPLFVTLAALSDALDGPAARISRQQTFFGKMVDCLRDRLILVAAIGNVAIIDTRFVIIFFFVTTIEAVAFIKKDLSEFQKKEHGPEKNVVRWAYITSFCATAIMTAKVYWNFPFLPALWFFALIFLATSITSLFDLKVKYL